MEALREKLHKYIDLYGVLDERTIEISQKLDKLIVMKMEVSKVSTKVLGNYIKLCKQYKVKPTIDGLKKYHKFYDTGRC